MKNINLIISFTTFDVRLHSDCVIAMLTSILNQKTDLKYHIVMNVYKEHILSIKQNLKDFISKNNIELLICDKDIGPHTKYFYAMQKYRDLPIITVDDDIKYQQNLIDNLFQNYIKYPNAIQAARCHLMTFNNEHKIKKYNEWKHCYTNIIEPSNILFATGVGGVLYPPNCLNINDNILKYTEQFKTADDFLLKYLELKNNINICYVPNIKKYIDLPIKNNIRLGKINVDNGKNNTYIQALNKFFI